jgi:hypothetical protein
MVIKIMNSFCSEAVDSGWTSLFMLHKDTDQLARCSRGFVTMAADTVAPPKSHVRSLNLRGPGLLLLMLGVRKGDPGGENF